MGREATKAAGNPWFEARKKASEYDDRLCSREGAAERLGMSVSAVADAELGLSKCMPVDKAVNLAMVTAYILYAKDVFTKLTKLVLSKTSGSEETEGDTTANTGSTEKDEAAAVVDPDEDPPE